MATPSAWPSGSLGQRLFAPASIALVGASGDASRNTARPQQFLRRHGYQGRIYPVNPGRTEVLGERAYRSVADIEDPVDHAFVMVPAARVAEALRDCGRKRVPVVTVYSDGFAETGAPGQQAQAELVRIARELGIRLLGPNCIGMINPIDRVALTVNAALKADTPEPGDVALVSQSGSMLGTLLSRGQARGVRFSRMVSVGNEADLAVGELVELLLDDPCTRTVLLFLETLRDADRLAAAARRACAAGKAVVAYKLGRSALGSELAVSHTGALAGSDAAVDAFFRDAGIVRVDMLETLVEIAPLLAGGPPRLGRRAARRQGVPLPGQDRAPRAESAPPPPGGEPMRVAVVSTTGGGAAMVVDRMGSLGVAPGVPTPEFVEQMAARGIAIRPAPVIDLTLAATSEKYATVLQGLLDADFCDAVLAVVGTSAQFQPALAVEPIAAVAPKARKPLAVFLAPQADASLALLAQRGIAAFRTPEACADALAALARWRAPAATGRWPLPEAAAQWLQRAQAGPEADRRVLDERASLELFDALGIETVARAVLPPRASADELDQAAGALGWPVAAKLVSTDLPHKTQAGALALGLRDPASLRAAIDAMHARVAQAVPHARIGGLLLQRMEAGLAEAILGYREDPLVGPIVMLGLGGRLAELYRDVSLRVAPVSVEEARAMVDEVRGLALIRGYRGLPRGDVDALVQAVVAIGRLASAPGRPVGEAEINPLIVRERGVVAVDALVVLSSRAAC